MPRSVVTRWALAASVMCGVLVTVAMAGCEVDPDVLVLGAGMSGLAAARKLQESGLKVVVLEGQGRVGGRVNSLRLDDGSFAELGAGWIHGIGSQSNPNPVSKLAREYSVTFGAVRDEAQLFDVRTRKEVQPDRPEANADRFEDYLWTVAEQGGADVSVQQVLDKYIAQQGSKLSAADKDWLKFLAYSNFAQEYAADLGKISVKGDWSEDWSGDDAIFPGGYGQITDRLASGLCVQTGKEVSKVDYTGSKVQVTTSTGAQFSARAAVVTFSLGKLQQSQSGMFNPALPSKVVGALNRLKMGVMDKAIMVWDSPWWEKYFSEPWLVRGVTGVEWSEFYNMLVTPARLPILVAWSVGTPAVEMEKKSDADIASSAMAALQSMLPAGTTVPAPKRVIVTRWAQDKWARGSYSYVPVGLWPNRADLRSGVAGKVFFAGEHTRDDYPATVHGAYLSGVDAAGKVVSALRG